MAKYLIAGGNGFIGTNLCLRLINKGHEILVVDNCCTSNPNNMLIAGILTKSQGIGYQFVNKDIVHWRPDSQTHWNYIFNLASPASPPRYQKLGLETIMTNVAGAFNLLVQASVNKATFVQASTSEVYGNPHVHPQPEHYWGNVNSYGPRSCYDEGKRCAEALCYEFHERGVTTRIVRIFNTYGPYMDPFDGRVVSNFIVAALKNENLTVYGTGKQTRSFCYIDDLLDGIEAVVEHDSHIPFNVGNPTEFTVLELADKVLELIKPTKSKILFNPLPRDDPKQRRPDLSAVTSMTKWTGPKIPLAAGLEKTIEYFRSINLGNRP